MSSERRQAGQGAGGTGGCVGWVEVGIRASSSMSRPFGGFTSAPTHANTFRFSALFVEIRIWILFCEASCEIPHLSIREVDS